MFLTIVTLQVHIARAGDMTVVFEAKRGATSKGDIAVDDITFYVGGCPAPIYCEFEEFKCGFQNDINADFNWIYAEAQTQTGEKETAS